MKTLDDYIKEFQCRRKKDRDSGQIAKREQHVLEICQKDGFWVAGGKFLQESADQIRISYHGIVEDLPKLGYMHRHNYFEMMYVYRGGCVNKMSEHTIYLHEGDIVLLNPNVLHCPRVEHDEDVLLNLCISNNLVQRNIMPMLHDNQMFMDFFVDFLYRSPEAKRFLYFSHNSPAVRDLCESMCLEYFQKQDFYMSVLESSMTTLFALLARGYKSTYQMPEIQFKGGQIYEILTYIVQNCADVTLESLSHRFQYAPSYLSRLIKKHTSKSFFVFFHAQKMARVVQYLGATGLPVIDIANLAGFSDIVHFNKTFKAKFGQTPTEYRKSIQKRQ